MTVKESPSPHFSSRRGHAPIMIVIHGDAGSSDEGTLSWLASPDSVVSYHWLVGRDGSLYRIVEETEKAWHAGVSVYQGEEIDGSVNPVSIGVAFANDGTGAEQYRADQYEAGARLCADICRRWGIPLHRIRGHNEVSPGRKRDPWDWFDWVRFCRAWSRYREPGVYPRSVA